MTTQGPVVTSSVLATFCATIAAHDRPSIAADLLFPAEEVAEGASRCLSGQAIVARDSLLSRYVQRAIAIMGGPLKPTSGTYFFKNAGQARDNGEKETGSAAAEKEELRKAQAAFTEAFSDWTTGKDDGGLLDEVLCGDEGEEGEDNDGEDDEDEEEDGKEEEDDDGGRGDSDDAARKEDAAVSGKKRKTTAWQKAEGEREEEHGNTKRRRTDCGDDDDRVAGSSSSSSNYGYVPSSPSRQHHQHRDKEQDGRRCRHDAATLAFIHQVAADAAEAARKAVFRSFGCDCKQCQGKE